MKKTSAEIRAFIIGELSDKLNTAASAIPVDETLTNLGVSSREAVVLTAELEDFIGEPVDPALPWEYPTILALSEHLAARA